MTESQLLARAQQGDHEALEEICRREWGAVYAFVYQSVRNRAEAQDLTQEVFLRALRSLDRYRVTGRPFRAFLIAIARNLVRDRWRAHRPLLVGLDGIHDVAEPADGPEAVAVAADEQAGLHRALSTLSHDYQTVLQLRLIEGWPVEEVATRMGRSAGAIRQLQHRALRALRDKLREEQR